MVEYLVKWNELLQFFWQEPVKPVDGMISVSDRPGLASRSIRTRSSPRKSCMVDRAEHDRQRADPAVSEEGE